MDHENYEGEEICLSKKKNYTILNQEEVVKLLDDATEQLSTVFDVSKSDAYLLLLRSNFRIFDLADAWFDDENKIREKTGLLKKPLLDNTSEDLSPSCQLCSDSNSCNISSASCGHCFCGDCWRSYIRKSINEDGAACLMLRCPEPDCSAAVGPELVKNLMLATNEGDECYEKYKHHLLRSENQELMIKWCPAPDCNHAIRLMDAGVTSTTCYYVTCVCSRSYCWNCQDEENHHPVDCESAAKWKRKEPAYGNKYHHLWQKREELEKKTLEVFDEAKKMHKGLDFLLEACKQMVECRQVLRWTVVYGYYNMSDIEEQHPKHKLFEYWQDLAEVYLARLENTVVQFLVSAYKLNDLSFACFREKLQDLTKTTMTSFQNLVRTLEEGFPEHIGTWTCDRCTYVNAMSDVKCEICGKGVYWSCDWCTYLNAASTRTCSVCFRNRR